MANFKKISAVALCSAMALSLGACGNNIAGPDTTYAAVIDGYKVPAGVFIAMQMNSYYDAAYYTEPTDETVETEATTTAASAEASETEATTTTPFTDKVIEDKPVRDWINDEATKSMREFVAIENKFDELGLSFDENEKEKTKIYLDSIWEYYGANYEDVGISEDSQLLIMLNSAKKNHVFDYFYAEGGQNEISEADIKAYLEENNKRINYIKMELKDGEGNLLKSEGKEEIKKMAMDYIDRINTGEDFETVSREYSDYYDKLVADAAAAGAESTDETAEEPIVTESSYTDNETVVTKDSASPSEAVVNKAFEADVGAVILVEEDEVYYIVKILDLYADENYYSDNENVVRHELKDDEFDQTLKSWTETQNVELNEAAYKRYKVEKFLEQE
ncbi:MAG: hypothetical protein ACI4YB_09400 [Oscillospiraceae bacterium]